MAEPYGGYDYEFVDPLPDECPCAVCTLVQKEPRQVMCCGKIYCKSCLDQLIRKRNNCPNCRSYIFRSFPDLNTERKIKHLKIYCENKKNGCEWTGHLKDLEQAHVPKCPNQLVTCTNRYNEYEYPTIGLIKRKQFISKNCEAQVQRYQLEKHMEMECEYRVVACTYCCKRASHHFIAGEHTKTCPDMKVPCSNRGCEEQVERRLLEQHEKICPKSIITCRYSSVGCKAQITRDGVKTHNQENMEEHLDKAMAKLENVTRKLKEIEKKVKALESAKMAREWTGHLKDLNTHRNECQNQLDIHTKKHVPNKSVGKKSDKKFCTVFLIICFNCFAVVIALYYVM